MTRAEEKVQKKLRGVYKQCINVCSFNKNTKGFRLKLTEKIAAL